MGAKFVSNKDETIPLFKNPFLEYFSHIHPATPIVVYIPVVLWVAYLAIVTTGWIALMGMFVSGVLFWTLTEYTIHRWAFHYDPKTELGKKLHFLVHGIHHDYPRDSTRLVMPLLVSVPLAILFFFAFKYTLGDLHYGMFSGFVFGYVAYDSIHYATHHFPMTHRISRFVKEYHMKHHFVDDHTAFGVSNPLWDYVFNTVPEWARKRRQKNNPQVTN